MVTRLCLDEQLVQEAEVYAKENCRSVSEQIQHWAKIGRMVEDNPDLPYECIRTVLLAQMQTESGKPKSK